MTTNNATEKALCRAGCRERRPHNLAHIPRCPDEYPKESRCLLSNQKSAVRVAGLKQQISGLAASTAIPFTDTHRTKLLTMNTFKVRLYLYLHRVSTGRPMRTCSMTQPMTSCSNLPQLLAYILAEGSWQGQRVFWDPQLCESLILE